jgi:hypothetical protein
MGLKNWFPILTSLGIGAATYQMMRPHNKASHAIKGRMDKMMREKELMPNS